MLHRVRKMSPNAVFSVILCAYSAFWLAACIKPVSLGGFLEDGIVQTIIEEGKKKGITLEYEDPKDHPLDLESAIAGTISPVLADEPVIVPSGSFGNATIKVTNADEYDPIEWYCDLVLEESGDTFTGASIFSVPGRYSITVIGTAIDDGKPYGILFFIVVE
jgi:hypothetical protein